MDPWPVLDKVPEVTERPGLALDMSFRPGDVQIINNNVVLHSRTAFVDHQDVGGRRLLLRVWTSHRSSRPLPKAFGDLYGLVDAAGISRRSLAGRCLSNGCRVGGKPHSRMRREAKKRI
jgi:hypothetical protein